MSKPSLKSRPARIRIVFEYALWLVIAFLLALSYIYLLLGPIPKTTGLWDFVFYKLYFFGLLRLGLIIGCLVSGIFIMTDVYFLGSKELSSRRKIVLRILLLLVILTLVAGLHYLLEKVFNLI
ncbi:hypothetical protein [Leeuwenhoekiella sp. H156]|uniref:hypothetical protein n=1 Tax=Leeuwenhoekiella sp. H156 TaxID=3450128 RepID=UPI003FA4095E